MDKLAGLPNLHSEAAQRESYMDVANEVLAAWQRYHIQLLLGLRLSKDFRSTSLSQQNTAVPARFRQSGSLQPYR